ncbi:hypothetical protein DFJ74DRAFT_672811 [Hyaloraphidium curvatum]|nr:hypothetical protein DFJ74DRAFT_672811 [Hyaloraphidium curvatum]
MERPAPAGVFDEPVVVLGAGLTGLITASVLLRDGFRDVLVLEKHGRVGGVWAAGRGYPGLRSNNPRGSYRFSDFPFEREEHADEVCLRREEVQDALERFAESRVGMERILLDADVLSIEPVGELSDLPSPRWTVTYRIGGEKETRQATCTFLAVCTGLHSDPMPVPIPGRERFRGLVAHSSELGDPAVLEKVLASGRVAVVGCSKSAADVCTLLANHRKAGGAAGEPVTMLSRQNRYFVEIHNKDMVPVLRKGFAWLVPHWRGEQSSYLHGTKLGSWIAGLVRDLISWGMVQNIPPEIRPNPSLGIFQDSSIPVASSGLFDRVRDGTIRVVVDRDMELAFVGPNSLSLRGAEEGAQILDVDCVVQCTGWKASFSYLSPELAADLGLPHGDMPYRLYRGIAPVGVRGIAFNGFVRSIMNSLTSEVGAHWVSSLFQGNVALPPAEEQNREIDAIIEWQRKMYPTERRADLMGSMYMLHYVAYVEELLKDMGCRTNRTGTWTDPMAAYLPPLYQGLGEERRKARF